MSHLMATQGGHPPSRRRTSAGLRPELVPAHALRTSSHLTRRGRIAVLGVLLCLLLGAFAFGRAASFAATETVPRPTLTRTTVQSGETLWAVARRIAPERDPREVIAQLRRLNGMHTGGLQAGQQLLLPVAA